MKADGSYQKLVAETPHAQSSAKMPVGEAAPVRKPAGESPKN